VPIPLWLVLILLMAGSAAAQDRHSGYYYPEPGSFEIYEARAEPLVDSDRRRRIGFTVELAQRMLEQPYAPDFVLYAKGEEAEKMIIVALSDGALDTIYRARALLAQMTLIARGSPLFAQLGVEDYFVFYDLCRLMGFDQITVSDGAEFSHQILLE
jgi:hypothetical protein